MDIEKVKNVFNKIIPKHKKIKVYFYRLLLFPANLALIGTTDEELDQLVLDIDRQLKKAGVADDKKYSNPRYFFCNMTLVRFIKPVSKGFIKKVNELSKRIHLNPYIIDSVTLLTGNAMAKNVAARKRRSKEKMV